MLRYIGAFFALTVSMTASSEQCPIKYLESNEYTDIECQFYLGTNAYRNEVFSVAAAHWQYIQDAPIKYEQDEDIQAMALATLNFLIYQGLGIEQDRHQAVINWQMAASRGEFEARRHLGFAFGDNQYEHADQIKALGWLESIFILFPSPNGLSETDKSIYEDAKAEVEKLRLTMSAGDIKKAVQFAKSTIAGEHD